MSIFVTVVCPTYKRHRYIPWVIEQFNKQTYEKNLMELIIFDDSPSKYPFSIKEDNIHYHHDSSKEYLLWEKRNFLNDMAKGDIIVCMDDDDFYFETRVEHAVNTLEEKKFKLAGLSSMYIYDIYNDNLYFYKSKQNNQITNGTFAYTKSLLKTHKYKKSTNNCCEEITFTKNFQTRHTLLDPLQTFICISHTTNTVNKAKNMKVPAEITNIPFNIQYLKDINPILFWINMEKSHERKSSMLNQLTCIRNQRIIGVENPSVFYHKKSTKKEEACCFESHLLALNTFINSYTNIGVICEDDLDIINPTRFYEVLFYYMKSAPSDWEILQLYVIYNKKIEILQYNEWIKWDKDHCSTMIYLIRNECAQRIVKKFQNTKHIRQKLIADYHIYKDNNTYTISTPYFKENIEFDSLINPEHKQFHISNLEKLNNVIVDKKYPFN